MKGGGHMSSVLLELYDNIMKIDKLEGLRLIFLLENQLERGIGGKEREGELKWEGVCDNIIKIIQNGEIESHPSYPPPPPPQPHCRRIRYGRSVYKRNIHTRTKM